MANGVVWVPGRPGADSELHCPVSDVIVIVLALFARLPNLHVTCREEYTGDTYGLRSLDTAGALVRLEVDGVGHYDWINREDVFVGQVLDYLT